MGRSERIGKSRADRHPYHHGHPEAPDGTESRRPSREVPGAVQAPNKIPRFLHPTEVKDGGRPCSPIPAVLRGWSSQRVARCTSADDPPWMREMNTSIINQAVAPHSHICFSVAASKKVLAMKPNTSTPQIIASLPVLPFKSCTLLPLLPFGGYWVPIVVARSLEATVDHDGLFRPVQIFIWGGRLLVG